MSENRHYPKGVELKKQFLATISQYSAFEVVSDSELLCINFNAHKYWIFLKCVSYAGKSYPADRTRAQLPSRAEFNKVKDKDRFLFLGYDCDNDVYVCWDPVKVKKRLNKKDYVSFFSRKPLQESVSLGEVKEAKLTNGDKFVLFKRSDVPSFFDMIELHFPELQDEEKEVYSCNEPTNNGIFQDENHTPNDIQEDLPIRGMLECIEADISVRLLVDEKMAESKTRLEITADCMNNFASFYPNMNYKDWSTIVKGYMTKVSDEG